MGWLGQRITAVQLPDSDRQRTEAAIAQGRRSARPPSWLEAEIERLRRHLSGAPQAFGDTPVDLSCNTAFERSVLHQTRRIPSGATCSYGELAREMGKPGAARAVGRALGRNPVPVVIPCHRVVASGGRRGGFSAPGGLTTKARLLALEGVAPDGTPMPAPLWQPGVVAAAAEHLADTGLGPVIEAVGPCTLQQDHPGNPFAALCEAICYQQLAGKAAAAITARLCQLFGGHLPGPEELHNASHEDLAGAGLSGAKRRALLGLAEAVVSGRLRLELVCRLPDDEVAREITVFKGLGPWTADMFLLFHLGRPDVFPVGDLGVRKAAARLWGTPDLPDPAAMRRRSLPWRPYRSLAAWYLWRSLGTVTMGS